MEILHVSAECYPVAKAGGLGDVVGALPKYQTADGHIAKVVMPMYRTKFLFSNEFEVVHKGYTNLGDWWFIYTVIKEKKNTLGFDLYLVDINGLLDRDKIYGYDDDPERFIAFQITVVDWLANWKHHPDVVHVHDHSPLSSFMLKHCYRYQHLREIPTVLTIHNNRGWLIGEKSLYTSLGYLEIRIIGMEQKHQCPGLWSTLRLESNYGELELPGRTSLVCQWPGSTF